MRQRGFSSVLLIAIIVLLATMSSFALRFVAGAQGSAATDLQAIRVQQAAEAALEWQRYQLHATPASCVSTTTLVIPFSSGGITATVTCNPSGVHTEGTAAGSSYKLTATACWPQGPSGCPNVAPLPDQYIERKISASGACVRQPPPSTAPVSCTW